MTGFFYLSSRYLRANPRITAVLILAVGLTAFVPVSLYMLGGKIEARLNSRAESTPLMLAPRASALDMVLKALYFRPAQIGPLTYDVTEEVDATGLGYAIPLSVRYSVGPQPVVGTTLDYFDFRGLKIARGRQLAMLGECVLGADAARKLGLDVGDAAVSSAQDAFDVAGSYPLKMHVVGILSPAQTADDDAVFVDIKTAWTIAGLAHGHENAVSDKASPAVLERQDDNLVMSAALLPYTEITPDNIGSFHFHGDPGRFPVDLILIHANDKKSELLLQSRLGSLPGIQVLAPPEVTAGLLSVLKRVRQAVLAAGLIVGGAAVAAVVLIFVLSVQMRRAELKTLEKIGMVHHGVRILLAVEISTVLLAGLALAYGLAWLSGHMEPAVMNYFL